jgi:hypothetical protein
MRRTKRLAIIFVALAAWAILTATAASGLPSIEAAPVGSFVAEGSVKGTTTIETELGEKLTAEEAKVRLAITGTPSSLGQATIELAHVTEPKSKTECQTEGAPAGTVVVPGEFHVVWTSLSPLEVAALLLFTEVVAKCNSEKLKVKVRAPVLMHLNVPFKESVLSAGLSAKCTSKGKQSVKEYFNDEGKSTKGVLTANFGLGFETACLSMEKELTLNGDSTFEVLG